jgi:chorismate mutase/prephenate dehydratase
MPHISTRRTVKDKLPGRRDVPPPLRLLRLPGSAAAVYHPASKLFCNGPIGFPNMANAEPSLDDLRRQIDDIDEVLHKAVMQRMSLIGQIADAKRRDGAHGLMMRPGREAQLLRELVGRHDGALPVAALLRMWREMINAATSLQGPMSVAVCAPQKSVGFWDMARNHFGSQVRMSLHQSPVDVLRRIEEEDGLIGVLPLPQEGEAGPWWPRLISTASGAGAPRVVWKLPFFEPALGGYEPLGAYAIAAISPEPSGDDQSLVAVDTSFDLSRARLTDSLKDVGLPGRLQAAHEQAGVEIRQHLFELDDFVADGDARLDALREKLGEAVDRVAVLGAYPRPLKRS